MDIFSEVVALAFRYSTMTDERTARPKIGMVNTLSHDGTFLAGGQFCCFILVQCYNMRNARCCIYSSSTWRAGLEFRHTRCSKFGYHSSVEVTS